MSSMYVPASFTSLHESAFAVGRPVTAQKIRRLSGNSAWLYEAFTDLAVPGNAFRSLQTAFNHCGDGTGKPIQIVMNIPRGWFGAGTSLTDAIALVGDNDDHVITQVVPDFCTGGAVDGTTRGYNWQRQPGVPFAPHSYIRVLRALVRARLSSGSGVAKLFPVVYNDAGFTAQLGQGDPAYVTQNTFSTVELVVDLTEFPWARDTSASRVWYWGVKAWVPAGCSLEIEDDETTAPCLALCSR